jgi:hypothetical protein
MFKPACRVDWRFGKRSLNPSIESEPPLADAAEARKKISGQHAYENIVLNLATDV